jgi:acetyl esterase/lipase
VFDKLPFHMPHTAFGSSLCKPVRLWRLIVRLAPILFLCVFVRGNALAEGEVIRLWPGTAPGSESWTQKEVRFNDARHGGEAIRNVVDPTLTVSLPAPGTADGTAIIVCPGGAFQLLAWEKEGTEVTTWLNRHGITTFLLKYRLANTGETDAEFARALGAIFKALTTDNATAVASLKPMQEIAAADARKAIETVRKNAAKWQISRIGILGFSAGAGAVIGSATRYDSQSRPDFAVSVYGPPLLGAKVPPDAPPLFIACASDDPILPVTGNLEVFSAWKSGGRSVEMHIYAKGGHAFAVRKRGLPVDHWTDQLEHWLTAEILTKPNQ